MLIPSQVPQNYNQPSQPNPVAQFLRQIQQLRAQQGAGLPATYGQMPQAQAPQAQNSQPNDPNSGAGIQALSTLMGYKPNTTFGYDLGTLSGVPSTDVGPQQSMNFQQALGAPNLLTAFGSLFGGQ